MKKQAHDNLDCPIQLVDVLSDAFEKKVMRNQQAASESDYLKLDKYKDEFYKV